jgi:hypothetical protein
MIMQGFSRFLRDHESYLTKKGKKILDGSVVLLKMQKKEINVLKKGLF